MTQASQKPNDSHPLDALTGGAFSAATSGERAARVREWLAGNPAAEQIQDVFKDMSARDKGAARPLRERLDELKRAKGQEAIAAEWADKAQALLALPRLNIADALAWQRDAAKAGAPLSKEPLAAFKVSLADRVKGIEDLQHRVQVQREAAVLLAQRIEILSTKPLRDAQAAWEPLKNDVPHWQAQADALVGDGNWASLDPKYPSLLDASRAQLSVVWDAFQGALTQAAAAASDANAPLPPVPVWADELRVGRGQPAEAAPRPAKPKVDPEVRARATQAVRDALAKVEQEVAEGHGKASAGAAAGLRNALKEHGKLIDDKLEGQVHAALAAAGELEGWQRWRADQLREELVAKAEALFERPAPAKRAARPAAAVAQAPVEVAAVDAAPEATEGAEAASAEAAPAEAAPVHATLAPVEATPEQAAEPRAPKPRFGGRKMQETLRALREQWKQVDQGGAPNHALWKRFDEACNEAYKVVEAWLDKVKTEAAGNRAQRLALIEELKAWTQRNTERTEPHEWKAFSRALHQLGDRWRDAGQKAFAELQPLWKEAYAAAAAPLDAAQKQSLDLRHAMIEEARVLGAAPMLRIDAVKSLQQRWQAEAQSVPLDRKHEQKLWDAFRKPIDDAFNRKTEEREKSAAALSDRDRVVLDASKALEAANATGDGQKIRAAMSALDAALRGQAQAAAAVAQSAVTAAETDTRQAVAQEQKAQDAAQAAEEGAAATDAPAAETPAAEGTAEADAPAPEAPAPAAPPKPAAKPVVAMRGDDRPGMKKSAPVQAGRGGKFGDRKDGPRGASRPGDNKFEPIRDDRGPRGGGRFGDRPAFEDRGPRLGDVAFRAQREALEHAEMALKKLAAQAHGEALTQLLGAWEHRNVEEVPSQQDLGRSVPAGVRGTWTQALGKPAAGDASQPLLRLEIAAEAPTPAEHISARRMMQLQLLTRRNDPSPEQTWGEDTAKVLATPFDAGVARRLQNVLKTLLRK